MRKATDTTPVPIRAVAASIWRFAVRRRASLSCWRQRSRCCTPGAMAKIDARVVATNATKYAVSVVSPADGKPLLKGTIKRNAKSTWIPGRMIRSSWRSSLSSRSRSCGDDAPALGIPACTRRTPAVKRPGDRRGLAARLRGYRIPAERPERRRGERCCGSSSAHRGSPREPWPRGCSTARTVRSAVAASRPEPTTSSTASRLGRRSTSTPRSSAPPERLHSSGQGTPEPVSRSVSRRTSAHQKEPNMSIYDIPISSLDGTPDMLGEQRGKVALVVNVASKCGLTPQYEGLERIHERYADRSFTVLGFPCNQFLEQEPGSAE